MSLVQQIADYYVSDARHFLHRYSLLPIEEFNKAGRVKNFMDVVMAAECVLKAHIFLGAGEVDPVDVYRQVRRMSHDVSRLADAATFLRDRAAYDAVKLRFGGLSVGLRYSLDMWETFFPSFGSEEATRQYDRTLANTIWRNEAIAEVEQLIAALARPPEDIGAEDFDTFVEDIQAMKDFSTAIGLQDSDD